MGPRYWAKRRQPTLNPNLGNNLLDSTTEQVDYGVIQEAEDLWFLMQQSNDPRRRGMPLTCYCDDSGSHDQAKVAVVGGLLLTKERFVSLHGQWKKILDEFRLDKVHMRDFVRPHGKYSTMAPEMKKALFASVAHTINQHKIYSVAASIPNIEYRTLLTPQICREFMGPYAMGFMVLTILNRMAVALTDYDCRVAYLIDKGTDRHHEQLNGAHTVIVHIEKREGESFTGAIAADLDDNNYALQAADVVAWAYHRKLEAAEFGSEFEPLLPIVEYQLKISPTKTKLHLSLDVPLEGVELFASLVNRWLTNEGPIPTWQVLTDSARF